MSTAFFKINVKLRCWALRHQFKIMVAHPEIPESFQDVLIIPLPLQAGKLRCRSEVVCWQSWSVVRYWRRKVPRSFPQGRRFSQLPHFPPALSLPTQPLCTATFVLAGSRVPLSAPAQGLHSSHTSSFCLGCESFGHLWQEGQSPAGGIVMLGEANSYRARPLMKR